MTDPVQSSRHLNWQKEYLLPSRQLIPGLELDTHSLSSHLVKLESCSPRCRSADSDFPPRRCEHSAGPPKGPTDWAWAAQILSRWPDFFPREILLKDSLAEQLRARWPIGRCYSDAVLLILAPFARKIMPLFVLGRLRGALAPSAKTAVAGKSFFADWARCQIVAVSLTLAVVWTLSRRNSRVCSCRSAPV